MPSTRASTLASSRSRAASACPRVRSSSATASSRLRLASARIACFRPSTDFPFGLGDVRERPAVLEAAPQLLDGQPEVVRGRREMVAEPMPLVAVEAAEKTGPEERRQLARLDARAELVCLFLGDPALLESGVDLVDGGGASGVLELLGRDSEVLGERVEERRGGVVLRRRDRGSAAGDCEARRRRGQDFPPRELHARAPFGGWPWTRTGGFRASPRRFGFGRRGRR